MLSLVAPLAGLLLGLYLLVPSIRRFLRGEESARALVGWAAAAAILPSVGWQLRTLGLGAAIGYPLFLLVLHGIYVYGTRARTRESIATGRRSRPNEEL